MRRRNAIRQLHAFVRSLRSRTRSPRRDTCACLISHACVGGTHAVGTSPNSAADATAVPERRGPQRRCVPYHVGSEGGTRRVFEPLRILTARRRLARIVRSGSPRLWETIRTQPSEQPASQGLWL